MKKIMKKAAALAAVISLATAPMAFAGGSVGYGDISVYKNETLTGKLSGQNPVEDGALLVCDGKCMLKSEGISLVAADQSKMAVTNGDGTFNLYVQEGKVDYVITSNARKIAFYTPQGTYTVAEVVFNADSNPVVKGSVVVDASGKTEISVTEGRMVFATADGMKTVDADHKIVLAVAPEGQGGGDDSGMGLLLLGGGALATVLVVANDSGDSGGGTPGPTPTPTPTPTPSPAPVKKAKTTTASPSS
jgi:hypothetical protein